MVNSMGHEFSDVGGSSIQTIPGGGDLSIDKEGLVYQSGQNIGQVGVFVFEDPLMDLQKVGGGFVAKEVGVAPEPADPEQFTIMQGYLESIVMSPQLRK